MIELSTERLKRFRPVVPMNLRSTILQELGHAFISKKVQRDGNRVGYHMYDVLSDINMSDFISAESLSVLSLYGLDGHRALYNILNNRRGVFETLTSYNLKGLWSEGVIQSGLTGCMLTYNDLLSTRPDLRGRSDTWLNLIGVFFRDVETRERHVGFYFRKGFETLCYLSIILNGWQRQSYMKLSGEKDDSTFQERNLFVPSDEKSKTNLSTVLFLELIRSIATAILLSGDMTIIKNDFTLNICAKYALITLPFDQSKKTYLATIKDGAHPVSLIIDGSPMWQ